MECRVFETFQKKSKNFQNSNQKRTKQFPRESKSVLNMFWGNFFEKFLSPVLHGGSRLRKFSKKSKKISKFQKCPKSFPKVFKRGLKQVLGQIFRKIFDQFSMECRVFETFQKNQKKFKIPKRPKIVPKSIQTSSERVLRQFFSKNFCPVFHGGSSLRKFSKKNKDFSKFQKSRKSLPKVSKRVLNLFWGKFFQKNFLPSLPWMVESSKIFE